MLQSVRPEMGHRGIRSVHQAATFTRCDWKYLPAAHGCEAGYFRRRELPAGFRREDALSEGARLISLVID